ncbi:MULTISPECIES: DUF1351 domain-containing protein [unclassified Enterococcus]|uniref:DUF1351 domain-containing protein n=1 Tax=unclassified Enterococcus TaxID=2608891 RepID=UPI001553B9AB|nr:MULTISPECIES: DUF1351 domain-containing protein [unclassified Enterococcus]MBS7578381.1 DUF1351 domain-containing protein [Enterococcus sp. MMGLQ5-2]MBS7585612.1 DUF1351 domain-containing protein [Enterococcus sp. MMGLQ5-1]NPD13471.1 DUF1351 domain-containing protein [Enterococcus sp. MMGLQ5-1]NPD38213.1 DUF1351 domain-containing protein [Enterococcus sp. MMGLQ5-2]
MNEIKVNFKPSIIQIEERDQVEKNINELVKKYKGYEVTADTLTGDRKIRASLNKVLKGIDDKRKEIKNEFNQPLEEFQEWVKKASAPLNDVVANISKGIKELEEHEKELRYSAIKAEFERLATEAELDPRIFEIKQEWLKAGNFLKDYKLKKELLDVLIFEVDKEKQRVEEFKKASIAISSMAFDNNLSDSPYLSMLKNGQELTEIITIINSDIQREKIKQEAEDECKRIEQEQAELAKQNAFEIVDETAEKTNLETAIPPSPRKKSMRIVLEIIIDRNNPLPPFRPFLDSNGYNYKILKHEELDDDK